MVDLTGRDRPYNQNSPRLSTLDDLTRVTAHDAPDPRLAAAPALLSALQDLLDALPAHSFPGTDVAQAVRAAQEAVRLATGESEEANA